MAFAKELILISLLLMIFVEISKGNANQPSKLDKGLATYRAGLKSTPKTSKSGERTVIGYCENAGDDLVDSESCSIFYSCYGPGETPIQNECLDGTNFVPQGGYCDYKYVCPLPIVCEYTGQIFPNGNDCSSYYNCTSTTSSTLVYCPAGMFYDWSTNICDSLQLSDCSVRPACVDMGQRFGDYYDCTQYYVCDANLKPIKNRCPMETSYDSVVQDCIISHNAICTKY